MGPTSTRRGLSPAELAHVRDAVCPGGTVTRVRPLRGGLSSSVHLVHLSAAQGGREVVVVRRYGAYSRENDPGAGEREFRVLEVLSRHGLPVPRPLLLEPDGGAFGTPTVVMSRVAGRPELAPRDMRAYVRQMAGALVRLHALPATEFGFLPDQAVSVERALRDELRPADDPLQLRVFEAARRLWPTVPASEPRLVHGDYWPANVLWNRGQLVGVVDWEQTVLGEATKDVATCRGDLSILFGSEVADAFLRAYVEQGGHVQDLQFWELLISTQALREIEGWATVYPLLRRGELTVDLARARIRAFAAAALARHAS